MLRFFFSALFSVMLVLVCFFVSVFALGFSRGVKGRRKAGKGEFGRRIAFLPDEFNKSGLSC